MAGIPIAEVRAVRDALTALIDAEGPTPTPPPPSGNTTLIEGQGGSLSAGGHVWTFGAYVDARGSIVLRDGVQYASGVARKLVLSAGAVWAEAAPGNWYRDTGTYWAAGGSGP